MKKVLILDALEKFRMENVIKGLSDASLDFYNSFIQNFSDWLPKKLKFCSQLTEDTVQPYVLSVHAHFSNKNSVNTRLRAFRRFINFCAEKRWLVPFKIAMVKTVSTLKPTYNLEDFEEIIFDRSKQGLICLLLLSLGIRSRTLRFIRVEDFNYPEKTLFLRELKNKSQTLLPLPEYTAHRLRGYIRENGLAGSDILFQKSSGGMYSKSGLYNLVCDYLKKYGIDKGGVHKFRYTFAKYFSKVGGSSIALSHMLTHSTVDQSEHYTAVYGNELRDFISCNPVETLLKSRKKAAQTKSRD